MNNESCNKKTCLIASIVAFIFIFVFDFIWHGMLLKGAYQETAHLWRPEGDMGKFFPVALLFQLAIAFIVVGLYKKTRTSDCSDNGVCFGVTLGLLFAVMMAGMYPYMPISLGLAGMWALGGFLQGLGLGVLLSKVYKG